MATVVVVVAGCLVVVIVVAVVVVILVVVVVVVVRRSVVDWGAAASHVVIRRVPWGQRGRRRVVPVVAVITAGSGRRPKCRVVAPAATSSRRGTATTRSSRALIGIVGIDAIAGQSERVSVISELWHAAFCVSFWFCFWFYVGGRQQTRRIERLIGISNSLGGSGGRMGAVI